MKQTIPLDNFLVNIFRFSSTLSDTERHCFWERFEGKTYKEIGKTCPRVLGGIGLNPNMARMTYFRTQREWKKYEKYHYLYHTKFEDNYTTGNIFLCSKSKKYQIMKLKQREISENTAPKIKFLQDMIEHYKKELKKYYEEIRELRDASRMKGLYK